MDTGILKLLFTVTSSGTLGGLLVWIYKTIKDASIRSFQSDELFIRVDALETKQSSHEVEHSMLVAKMKDDINALEKKFTNTNRDLDIRLTKMEVDIIHIKELQMLHNQSLNEASKDIKQLLSRK